MTTTKTTTYTKEEIKTLQAYAKMECERLEKEFPDLQVLKVSRRNKKLVPNHLTAFIIWNLPAKITCPYATDHCKKCCYAVKSEVAYPDVIPSRQKHLLESKQDDFTTKMIYTILKIASGTNKSEIIVRIHESGDFYNKYYAMKWLEIARACSIDKRIKFMAYTKIERKY